MKMFFQLAFVCSVGLFGCGSQVSHASRGAVDAAKVVQPAADRVNNVAAMPRPIEVKAARQF